MNFSDKPPAIFVMGPTASGKTDLAISLSQHLPVDIISVDSVQVYKQFDIGSAKPDPETLSKHPHKLVNIKDPAEIYSVADFIKDAKKHMSEISSEGRVPLLVGGTMLYFRKLLDGLPNLPQTDNSMREKIYERASKEGWPVLYKELMQIDPKSASKIHPNHSQRIQRALEVYYSTGMPLSEIQARSELFRIEDDYNIVQISLIPSNRDLLHQRIEDRFNKMMLDGFEAEAKRIYLRKDLPSNLPVLKSAGYRQLWRYFDGEIELEEAIERGIIATRQLAKRQITWLRSWSRSNQIHLDNGEHFFSTDNMCEQTLKILGDSSILWRRDSGISSL
jgi:tRNA dimethylallyltransferase